MRDIPNKRLILSQLVALCMSHHSDHRRLLLHPTSTWMALCQPAEQRSCRSRNCFEYSLGYPRSDSWSMDLQEVREAARLSYRSLG